ncbi:hypothetical protein [Nitratireductor sp. ZSWI3]|nr:hypothetical protein [Nitratireductor sp. ZSWI3]MCR4264688.1 hypothetical protein [Nitratireductor sp. ZSWI3]
MGLTLLQKPAAVSAETMKAAVVAAPQRMEVVDVPLPVPAAAQPELA